MEKQTVHAFTGTAEQEAKLKEVIKEHHDQPGGLMPVLQGAQEIYGYLPIEFQQMIADGLNISLSEVYGVATFYSQFSLTPKGKNRISVCLGTACYVKFSLDSTRCVGACGLAPVMLVNDEVYGKMTPEQVDGIIDKYAKAGDAQ